jgi:hypothetical protein
MNNIAAAALALSLARNQLRDCPAARGIAATRLLAAADALFRAAAPLQAAAAAHTLASVDPLAAVRIAIEAARDSGAVRQDIADTVNQALAGAGTSGR